MKYIPKYQKPFLPILPSYNNLQSTQDNVRVQYPQEDVIKKEEQINRAHKLRLIEKEKALQEHYNRTDIVGGMKRKPTAEQINYQAQQSVAYNDKLRDNPVGTLGPDIALSLVPELLMLKGPSQAIGKGLSYINPLRRSTPWEPSIYRNLATKINPPERLLTEEELFKLNKVLDEKGILPQQKTINWPWKEPIRKGVEPFGYETSNAGMQITGNKFKDIKGAIFGGKNPAYQTPKQWLHTISGYDDNIAVAFRELRTQKLVGEDYEKAINNLIENTGLKRSSIVSEPNLRKAINNRANLRIQSTHSATPGDFSNTSPVKLNNRYTTWDMYLGKPQTKHPMYSISPLSTNKKLIYTIKPEYTNQRLIKDELKENIGIVINRDFNPDQWKRLTNNGTKRYTLPDTDASYFGTMGGFNWQFRPLENGNVEAIANDIWDLHPLQSFKLKQKWIPEPIKKVIQPIIRKTEAGKFLGIGKPLDVKVGFEFDKTGNIIRQFENGGNL